jgi:hypothetical protein
LKDKRNKRDSTGQKQVADILQGRSNRVYAGQKEVTGTLQDGSDRISARENKKAGTLYDKMTYSVTVLYSVCKRTIKPGTATVNLVNYSTYSITTLFY